MDNVNFRSALPQESRIFGGPTTATSIGAPPPIPPRVQFNNAAPMGGMPNAYSSPMQNYYGYGGGGYGGGFGGYGAGGAGMFSSYGYGSGGGMFGNRYGGGGMGMYGGGGDVESRFIQMAEENSRPAFQSIESFVSVIGNFASMLDSTFFALSNSFRAILGVTANLGKLRNMFGQFLSSIALFRGLHWLWRKILYTLHMSKTDPSSTLFKEAFNVAAANGITAEGAIGGAARVSAWPMVAFLSFIFATPYLIMKMVGRPNAAEPEACRNPRSWTQPIASQALHTFQATSAQELSVNAGEVVYVAPKEIQQQMRLMNTGWAMATKDFSTSGMVPINYLQRYSPQQSIPVPVAPLPESLNRVFDSAATTTTSLATQLNDNEGGEVGTGTEATSI